MQKILFFLLNIQFIYSLTWNGNTNQFPTGWKISAIANKDLLTLVADPVNSANKVIKIRHPKASCSSTCGIPGGAGFNILPFDSFNGNEATLQFDVYFPSNFEFVKGGKLVGMYGGGNGCSGCTSDVTVRSNCFSARMCWGANGNGFPYLYLPLDANHEPDFCKLNIGSNCDARCGLAFNQTRYFEKNKWNTVKEYVKMNTPGRSDGILQVWVNGVKKVDYRKMIWRSKTTVGVKGITVHPFFGGGESFQTPVDTYTLYRTFKFADYLF